MYGVSYFEITNKKKTSLYLGVDALGKHGRQKRTPCSEYVFSRAEHLRKEGSAHAQDRLPVERDQEHFLLRQEVRHQTHRQKSTRLYLLGRATQDKQEDPRSLHGTPIVFNPFLKHFNPGQPRVVHEKTTARPHRGPADASQGRGRSTETRTREVDH